jgi:ribosomal protein S18 acetylase RimI-like enzyme
MSRNSALATTLPASTGANFAAEPGAMLLGNSAEAEVMEFLAQRPLHTIILAGMVADNGLANPLNRGDFFACRNAAGELEGVALIGDFVLMEARTNRAVQEFAKVASYCTLTRMIMGESHVMDEFWSSYEPNTKKINRVCHERLLEAHGPIGATEPVTNLRVAMPEDLELLLPVHAQMALEESGTNPLERDPEGFRSRYLRRVVQKRTWVLIEDHKLIFKAEIISDTPGVAYLEGVWVNSEYRCHGVGTRCLVQLVRQLLSTRSRASVCVFVNERNPAAIIFYERAGFKSREVHETFFLR